MGLEAQLAGEQIASGVTSLGRANHAEKGYYTHALFGLSIGIERIAKLIAIADYAIDHSGSFPSNKYLKRVGHDLGVLLQLCESIAKKHQSAEGYTERPNDTIHQGIVETLTEFAKMTRYYNLDLLTGKTLAVPEPISAWWRRVGQPILARHYSPRQRHRDEEEAKVMQLFFGESALIVHSGEEGDDIRTLESLLRRAGATRVLQKYGRLYTLQIVRWLASLVSHLSSVGAYKKRIEPLLGLNEPFVMFRNPDQYLRDRKTWSIYRL